MRVVCFVVNEGCLFCGQLGLFVLWTMRVVCFVDNEGCLFCGQ